MQTLPCTHAYHTECVAMLRKFGVAQVFPLCRADLPPGPKLLFDDAMRRWWVLARRYGQGDGKLWREVHRRDRREVKAVMRMLEEAADQGEAQAQCNIGVSYHHSQGVPQNHSTATEWYRKAADQGHAMAQVHLGRLYALGVGVPKDSSQALRWLRKAEAQCS